MNQEMMEVSAILSYYMQVDEVRRDRTTHPRKGTEFNFFKVEGGYSLTRFRGDMADVEIPDTHQGEPVVAIAPYAFAGCETLRTVKIPHGVTEIGSGAFGGCTGLEKVTLPQTLTRMGDQCFAECESLTTLVLPDALEEITVGLCRSCSALHDLRLPLHKGLTIGWQAFSECGALSNVEIPQGTVVVGEMAFFNCGKLQSVSLPESLRTIGSNAFSFCRQLTAIAIPEGVRRMGTQVFFGCSALESVALPASLQDVEGNLFGACVNLADVTVAPGNPVLEMNGVLLTHLPRQAVLSCLCGQDISFIIVPAGTREIADHAFTGCKALRRVTLPEGIQTLGNAAFSDCKALRAINLPGSLTDIGVDMFDGSPAVVMEAPADTYASSYVRKRQPAMIGMEG